MSESGVITRAKKTKGYESISREFLQEHQLSWGARGLLSYVASMPENYRLKKTKLYSMCSINGNGRRAVEKMWDELVEKGYIVQFKKPESKGYNYAYKWDDTPFTKDALCLVVEDMAELGYELYMTDAQKNFFGVPLEAEPVCDNVEDNSISVQNAHSKQNVDTTEFPTVYNLHSIECTDKVFRFNNSRFSEEEEIYKLRALTKSEDFKTVAKLFWRAGVSTGDIVTILTGISADRDTLMDSDLIVRQLDWCVIVAKTEGIANFGKYYINGLRMKAKNASIVRASEFDINEIVKATTGYDVSDVTVPMFNWME